MMCRAEPGGEATRSRVLLLTYRSDVCLFVPAARPRGVRHPSMILAGCVGFTGAMAHGVIQAQSRLMGYSPNAVSEQKKVRNHSPYRPLPPLYP